jgi:hypothetical protein
MDKYSPGDGDDVQEYSVVDSDCIHPDVECEQNYDSNGNPECPCLCDDCQPVELPT